MPGYLTDPVANAAGISISASGNISAPNVQDAIYELDSEKAPSSGIAQSAVTNLVYDLSAKAPLASPTFTGTVSASVANISSNLTVDTNTLFVDAANNRVGIGTVSPTQPLQVQGNSLLNGEVVIGRTNSVDEGGQVSFARSSDNTAYWNVDTFGSTSTPTLRFFNDGTVKLQIDSSGRINKPAQPSFWAWTTSSFGTGVVIVYNNTQHNVGNHYNTTNGRFTAPVSGRYMFTINSIGNSSGTCRLIPRINGSTTQFGISQFQLRTSNGGNYSEGSLTFIWNLSANDYVDIYNNETTAYSDGSGYLNWCGSLIA